MASFNDQIIDEFRSNDGKVGGPFAGGDLLLLHSTGARSGAERINPLAYVVDGDDYVIIASKGGAPTNPDWFHNLRANPRAVVEVGSRTVPVTATVLDSGPERNALFAAMVAKMPGFADYEARTDRIIPVVRLSPR